MNKLLQLNRKLLILILIIVSIILLITIFLNNNTASLNKKITDVKESKGPNFDIINPSFTINNKQKISVKAKRGNFISDKKILLEKNVVLQSSKFKLQTNKALYNQSDQTAKSKDISTFKSEKTTIISEGFEITDSGNIIFFNGKTKLNLIE